MSSVRDYDFKDAAQYVAGAVRQKGRPGLHFGVFYDPMTRVKRQTRADPTKTAEDPQAIWKKARESAETESKKLLREQAQDFVAWLKQQGAI